MTNEEATNWLLATLKGETGSAPLGDSEIRLVGENEVLRTRHVAHRQNNQLVFTLPVEDERGNVAMTEFVITVSRKV